MNKLMKISKEGADILRSKRSHKEIKIDSQDHYGGLAENTPDRKAIKKFKRPPAYQAGKLLQEQARQMERSGQDDI